MKKKKVWLLLGLVVAAVVALVVKFTLGPPGPPHRDGVVDAAARTEVIEAVISKLNRFYVYPEKAAELERELRSRQQRGEFDSMTSADQFAAAISKAMRARVGDKHLEVRYLEEEIPVPAPGKPDFLEDDAKDLLEAQRFAFGFETVGRLRGNLGYIELREFGRPQFVQERLSAAMTLLGDTQAMIIDLRRTHGGDPDAVMLFASYFFDHPTHLNDIWWREGERTEARWTTEQVPGRRYGEARPLFIVTSEDTFSAGEDFAYALKNAGRAVVVGETTAGGAHPGDRHRLTAHFAMNVPAGRAINPVTLTDWEGVGVEPNLRVSARNALDAAQVEALKLLIAREQDADWKRRLQLRLDDLR